MPIIVNLDVMMAKRKISLNELSERVGLTLSNLSILKTGKAKAIRFSTLEAICRALDCQPSDILEYVIMGSSSLSFSIKGFSTLYLARLSGASPIEQAAVALYPFQSLK